MAKKYRHLSFEERRRLMALAAKGVSRRGIADLLGRAPSTIARELVRNAGRRGYCRYNAATAAGMARQRRRADRTKFARHPGLWARVQAELRRGWSPEQIAGRLELLHSGDRARTVSHQTIYAAIYRQRGAAYAGLLDTLRHVRRRRRTGFTPISRRPSAVETRKNPGHWEGDLIAGARCRSAVGSLVER